MKAIIYGVLAATLTFGATGAAKAATIDVLFYGASPTWNNALQQLSDNAHTYDPWNDGSNNWNAHFWLPGGPVPDFTSFDVLFIPSSAVFGSGMNPVRLLAAKGAITGARGTRTFLTGQDADWHYNNRPGPVDNGPRGFIINAINWAASGAGLGIVSMVDGFFDTGSQWWTHQDSFLRDELLGYNEYWQDETVYIGPGQDVFPVNEGLTSAGLSNWGVSSHAGFLADIPGYATINFEFAGGAGRAITIVTLGEEAGGTTPPSVGVPEPSTLVLLAGLMGLAGAGRRFKTKCRTV